MKNCFMFVPNASQQSSLEELREYVIRFGKQADFYISNRKHSDPDTICFTYSNDNEEVFVVLDKTSRNSDILILQFSGKIYKNSRISKKAIKIPPFIGNNILVTLVRPEGGVPQQVADKIRHFLSQACPIMGLVK